MSTWFLPARSTADADWSTVVSPASTDGWAHTGLLVADLAAGQSRTVQTGESEYLVLPLSGGGVTVEVSGEADRLELQGRSSVWAGPSDLVYVPRGRTVTVTSRAGGRVALPFAPASADLPVCLQPAASVPVEMRGAGTCSRQVHNFGTPGTLAASKIIACEVYTPGGNWSSYPPHKHDEERPGQESELEEIYYFEVRTEPGLGAPQGADPHAYQRVYGTDDRPLDVLEEVRTGDVVLVPHGWHGPATVPPGYDLYYLNVMAGPGAERAWLICDDPAHGWIRQTWSDQPLDPRLPLRENGIDQ